MDKLTFYERYAFLKSNTTLGLISLYKLSNFKKEISKARIMYYKLEGDLMDYDYRAIEEYEYELRFAAWRSQCMGQWLIDSEGLSLSPFAQRLMDCKIAKEKLYYKKKVRK